MHRTLRIATALALAAAPASADFYEFTGALRFPDPSPNGSAGFLPEGVEVSGSGVASSASSGAPLSIVDTSGFTGTRTTSFASTAGYRQEVFLSGVGDGSFDATGTGGLRGRMAVPGLAERFVSGQRRMAFPLTTAGATGLGLGGTLPAISGQTTSVRFGTWTTGTVSEQNVVVESHPAMGSQVFGTVTGMGFDARTEDGMGSVQFVTPIRTVHRPLVCPLPPCEPVPGDYGAAGLFGGASVAFALRAVSRRRAARRS